MEMFHWSYVGLKVSRGTPLSLYWGLGYLERLYSLYILVPKTDIFKSSKWSINAFKKTMNVIPLNL